MDTPTSHSRSISTANAPAAIGPYSQAVCAGGLLFISGQLPIDPATEAFVEGGAAEQATQAIANISAILASEGLHLGHVVKTTVLLADLADFQTVNSIYAQYFQGEVLPARAAFQVAGLPKGALVEIEAVATTAGLSWPSLRDM